jgi:hypothetical protein
MFVFAQRLYIVAAIAIPFQTLPRFTTPAPDLNIVAPELRSSACCRNNVLRVRA